MSNTSINADLASYLQDQMGNIVDWVNNHSVLLIILGSLVLLLLIVAVVIVLLISCGVPPILIMRACLFCCKCTGGCCMCTVGYCKFYVKGCYVCKKKISKEPVLCNVEEGAV